MAKQDNTPLSFTDIVLRAEAETIRQAYEARVKIDELLAERAKAYEEIARLEEQVDTVLGDEGIFPFPPPPLPVAGYSEKTPASARPKPKKSAAKPAPLPAPVKQESKPTPPPGAAQPTDEADASDEDR